MSNEQLKHIFESSTCLTKKQMISYVSGNMTNEEAHAVETHLNSCMLCSDAVDGMLEQQAKALQELPTLNADFLKSNLPDTGKQINLTAASSQQKTIKKNNVQNLWRSVSLAAGLLLLVVSVWYYRMLQEDSAKPQIAQELPPTTHIEENTSSALQPIAMNEVATEDNSEKASVKAVPATLSAREAIMDDAKAMAPAFAEKKVIKQLEDVTVKAEKAPLIAMDERKSITSDEIEKMPTRSTNDIASTTAAAPAQTSFGNSYTPDKNESLVQGGTKNVGVYTRDAGNIKDEQRIALHSVNDVLERADKLYDAKQYNSALNIYICESKNEINSNDDKDKARLGAARCYIAIGDMQRAKAYLMAVAAKHGKHKREAKRLLKQMD